MLRCLRFQNFVRTVTKFKNALKFPVLRTKAYSSTCGKILLGSQFYNLIKDEKDLDLSLKKAWDEGEAAVLELMKVLKECIIDASKQYREILKKQIEITEIASRLGPLSEKWDELTPYRTIATGLIEELNDYMAVFKAIGQIAYDQTMKTSDLMGNSENLAIVTAVYKELEEQLMKEFELNKKIEHELISSKRDSILIDVKK